MNLNHRESNEQDREQLTKWIDADPAHKDLFATDFWLPSEDPEKKKGTKCLAVEDENGVAFYIRLDNVMRAYVQFPPGEERDTERIKDALKNSFLFVASGAKRLGYKEMIFDSVSKPLIRFFKRMGFSELIDTFKVNLQ